MIASSLSLPRLSPIGVLLSGGIDSCVLLAKLLREGRPVQPFYIATDVVWAQAEQAAIQRFLTKVQTPRLAELVVFELPLADLYTGHWSITGEDPPTDDSPDAEVFLLGRNALLAIKPLLWCQRHGIEELALGVLSGNPFADAQPSFLQAYAQAITLGQGGPAVTITRPFVALSKADVLRLGQNLPLELTFSCLAPRDGLHCGRCNKCGERRAAFQTLGLPDRTRYAEPEVPSLSPLAPFGERGRG